MKTIYILMAALISTALSASAAQAGTVYIKAERQVVSTAIPDVKGVAAVSRLPLFQIITAEQERPLEDVSLAELSLVGTSKDENASATVSAPIVSAYNNPTNSGSLPSSVLNVGNNNAAMAASQNGSFNNSGAIGASTANSAASSQVIKGLEGLTNNSGGTSNAALLNVENHVIKLFPID